MSETFLSGMFLPVGAQRIKERFCVPSWSHARWLEACVESDMLPKGTTMKRRPSLCWDSTVVVRATVMPEAVGQQVPECRKQGAPNKRFEEWNPEEDGISRNNEDHHIVDDPHPHQRDKDGTKDAEREPPAYNELCDKTDKCRNEQVHDLAQIDSQVQITYVDRDERDLT